MGKDRKSEVEESGMNREERKEKGRPKLFTQERKITEYIDFFYSLHHLYKYIESPLQRK